MCDKNATRYTCNRFDNCEANFSCAVKSAAPPIGGVHCTLMAQSSVICVLRSCVLELWWRHLWPIAIFFPPSTPPTLTHDGSSPTFHCPFAWFLHLHSTYLWRYFAHASAVQQQSDCYRTIWLMLSNTFLRSGLKIWRCSAANVSSSERFRRFGHSWLQWLALSELL